jgi:molybdate/tungstate transport system substrate-binding protein
MALKRLITLLMFAAAFVYGCGNEGRGKTKEVIVFHAGSLSVPLNRIREAWELKHPDVRILLEPAGSLVCARKITELKKPCDIIASADKFVINELLIPEYTGWSINFATNSIVIAFTDKSKFASGINSSNWSEILLRDDVIFARSDPDSDPGGYRSVFTIMLTGMLTGNTGLTEKLLTKNRDFIRPKEVDLVALVESGAADYMFQYRSVAIQHGLKYIELPDEVNLSSPSMKQLYSSVALDVAGKEPGSKIKVSGDYISYSISILDSAPHRDASVDFLGFILSDEGKRIFRDCGQTPISPYEIYGSGKLPPGLPGMQDLKN